VKRERRGCRSEAWKERRNKEKRDDGDQHTLGTLNPRITETLEVRSINDEKASLSLAVVWLSQTK